MKPSSSNRRAKLCGAVLFVCLASHDSPAREDVTVSTRPNLVTAPSASPLASSEERPLSTGLTETEPPFLLEGAFHEKGGELEITDTHLRFENNAFHMDRARYHATIAAGLDPIPSSIAFMISFSPAALRWSGPGGREGGS